MLEASVDPTKDAVLMCDESPRVGSHEKDNSPSPLKSSKVDSVENLAVNSNAGVATAGRGATAKDTSGTLEEAKGSNMRNTSSTEANADISGSASAANTDSERSSRDQRSQRSYHSHGGQRRDGERPKVNF